MPAYVQEKAGHYAFAPPSGDQIWLAKMFVTELENTLGPQERLVGRCSNAAIRYSTRVSSLGMGNTL